MQDSSPLVDAAPSESDTGSGLPVSFAADQVETDIDTWIEVTEIDSSVDWSIDETDVVEVQSLPDVLPEPPEIGRSIWAHAMYVVFGVALGVAMTLGSASLASATSGY